MEKGSVAICFVNHALSGLKAREIDLGPVLREAGIAPAMLGVPQARVPAAHYSALWLAVARALGDEFFGQDARPMKPGSFALLCHGASGARTLREALGRIAQGFGVLLDGIGVRVIPVVTDSRDDGLPPQAALELFARGGARPTVFAQETLLIMLHGLMCWLVRRRVPVRQATFHYREPRYSAEYRVMYSRELRFQAPATSLRFDAAWLDYPVRHDDRSVKAFLRDAPLNLVVKYADRTSALARVRRHLRQARPDAWPTFAALARALHLSSSSLRRRLMEEGATYQQIKDELRRDLAMEAFADEALPLAEIAARLGFAEPGAFHRAFRRWTGVQPGVYRAMHRGAGSQASPVPRLVRRG